jgi:hypothetical protein
MATANGGHFLNAKLQYVGSDAMSTFAQAKIKRRVAPNSGAKVRKDELLAWLVSLRALVATQKLLAHPAPSLTTAAIPHMRDE